MTVIIDSIAFVAPARDLYCQGCGHLPENAEIYHGSGNDNFGAWAAKLKCSKCKDLDKSPFFMCRICTAALFRLKRNHMIKDADLRAHSKKATHRRTVHALLHWVSEQAATAPLETDTNNRTNNDSHSKNNKEHFISLDENMMDNDTQQQSSSVLSPNKINNAVANPPHRAIENDDLPNTSDNMDNDSQQAPHHSPSNAPNENNNMVDAEMIDEFTCSNNDDNEDDDTNHDHTCGNGDNSHTNNRQLPPVHQQRTDWFERLRVGAGKQKVVFQDYFPYDNRIHYYEHESLSKGGGAKALVGNAFYGPNVPVHGLTALYGLLFCRLAMKLPLQDVQLLSHLLHYIRSPPNAVQKNGGFRDIVVPTSPSDVRSIFLKGKKSIQQCLPTIPVQQIGSHVYVSPIDCVRDLMGMGQSVEPLYAGATVHSRTPRGIQLLRSAYVWPAGTLGNKSHQPDFFVLPMYPWNDDIDPNNVKGNRHKVWVYLVTFAIPEQLIHRSSNTYIVAMGPGDEDHTEVEQRIRDDFITLANGYNFYFSPFSGPVRCVSLVYAHLADRPAKAASTCTLSGNSPLHSRFGYAGLLPNNLPSCDTCHKQRKERTADVDSTVVCMLCHDWSFDKLTYTKPSPFPPTSSDSLLNVNPITFESMKSAMSTLFDNVSNGNWKSRRECQTFSKTEGLPVSVSDAIFDLAKSQSTANDNVDTVLPPASLPPTWDHPLVEVEDWITAIMHQIFLGVVKASFGDLIKDFLTTRKKFSSFVSRTNRILGPLKDLRLSWLKVEPLSSDGKFGRFVSENYLAFARLSKWLYADLESFPANDPNYEDPPNKDLLDYSKKELGAWLSARGIQFQSRLGKAELLVKIQEAIDLCNGNWPPVKWFERQMSPPALAEELICSLLAMINRVMAKGDVSDAQAADTDRHIRIFLTIVHTFDKNRETQQPSASSPTPIWILKYNFVTLLSIPSCQLKHGSLRLLWEGDGKGEGALPKIKSAIKSLKGRWALHAVQRWYKSRVLDRVTTQLVDSLNDGDTTTKNDQLLAAANRLLSCSTFVDDQQQEEEEDHATEDKLTIDEYHVYKDIDKTCILFENSTTALSVVGFTGTGGNISFGIVFNQKQPGSRNALRILPIKMDLATTSYSTCGATYFKWRSAYGEAFEMPADRNFIKVFGVLLPNHNNTEGDQFFYLVTSDWEEIKGDALVGKPSSVGCRYG